MLLSVPEPTFVLHAKPSGHVFRPLARQNPTVIEVLIGNLTELLTGQEDILRGKELPGTLTDNMIITAINVPERESVAVSSTLGSSIYAACLGIEPVIMTIKGYCFRSCTPNEIYTTLTNIRKLYNQYKASKSLPNNPYVLTIQNTTYKLYFLSLTTTLGTDGLIPVELTALAIPQ